MVMDVIGNLKYYKKYSDKLDIYMEFDRESNDIYHYLLDKNYNMVLGNNIKGKYIYLDKKTNGYGVFKFISKDNKSSYVYVNEEGIILNNKYYYSCNFFSDGYGLVYDKVNDNNDYKYYYINDRGEKVSEYYDLAFNFSEGFACIKVDNEDDKYYFIDYNFERVSDIYKIIDQFFNGVSLVKDMDNKVYLIDKSFKRISNIYEDYDYSSLWRNDLYIVKKNGKWGVIDKNDNIKIDFKYVNLYFINENYLCYEKDDFKRGIINVNNNVMIEGNNYHFDNEYNYVRFGSKKFGLIDDNGNILVKEKYNSISVIDEKYFVIYNNYKGKIINVNNNKAIFSCDSYIAVDVNFLKYYRKNIIDFVLFTYYDKNLKNVFCGIFYRDGKVLVGNYRYINYLGFGFDKDLFIVSCDKEKYGIINKDNVIIVDMKYDFDKINSIGNEILKNYNNLKNVFK